MSKPLHQGILAKDGTELDICLFLLGNREAHVPFREIGLGLRGAQS